MMTYYDVISFAFIIYCYCSPQILQIQLVSHSVQSGGTVVTLLRSASVSVCWTTKWDGSWKSLAEMILTVHSHVRLCPGSGVLNPLWEHPRHAWARPPHCVRRRHVRKERLTEGKRRLSNEVLQEILGREKIPKGSRWSQGINNVYLFPKIKCVDVLNAQKSHK